MGDGQAGRAFMVRVLAATLAGKSQQDVLEDEWERLHTGAPSYARSRPWLPRYPR